MESLADFVGLTDLALRRRVEPTHGLFVAEGAQVAQRALAAGYVPRTLVVARERTERADIAELMTAVRTAGGTVVVESVDRLSSIAGFHVHRGVLGSFARAPLPSVAEVAARSRTLAVLEAVVNHTNVGSVIRSLGALGAEGLVLDPRCADPLYRRAIRTSMGAVFAVPFARAASWPGGLEEVRRAGFRVLALTPSHDAVDLAEIEVAPEERVALLLGTEGAGLSRRALAASDQTVSIRMHGGADSLNVAACAAVALWAIGQARRLTRPAGSSSPVPPPVPPAGS